MSERYLPLDNQQRTHDEKDPCYQRFEHHNNWVLTHEHAKVRFPVLQIAIDVVVGSCDGKIGVAGELEWIYASGKFLKPINQLVFILGLLKRWRQPPGTRDNKNYNKYAKEKKAEENEERMIQWQE